MADECTCDEQKETHEPEEYLAVAHRFVAEDEYGEPTCFIFFDGDERIAPFPNMVQPEEEGEVEHLLVEELAPWVNEQGVDHVVLTGGEPMKQGMCCSLIANLSLCPGRTIEVETNGISQIDPIAQLRQSLAIMSAFSATTADDLAKVLITMDHWLPGTEPLAPMCDTNYVLLGEGDTVRFIAATEEDLQEMEKVIADNDLESRCDLCLIQVGFGDEDCDCEDDGCCGGHHHDEDHECCGGRGRHHDEGRECCGGHGHGRGHGHGKCCEE